MWGLGGLEELDGSLADCAVRGIAVQGIKTPGSESLTVTPGRTWELALALQTVEQRLQPVVGEGILTLLVRAASPASKQGIVGFGLVLGREGMGVHIRNVSQPLSGNGCAQWHPPRDVPTSIGVGWTGVSWALVAQACTGHRAGTQVGSPGGVEPWRGMSVCHPNTDSAKQTWKEEQALAAVPEDGIGSSV